LAPDVSLDLVAELSKLLAVEHGLISAEHLTRARAAWPDGE